MKNFTKIAEETQRSWFIVNAADQTLGRIATQIAIYLRGKHKAEYMPHVDTGDYVIVINAKKVNVTGSKRKNKIYYSHSGWVGGLKECNFESMIKRHPERVIEKAVKGMLPSGPLGRKIFSKLKVYADEHHKHHQITPQELVFDTKKGKNKC